MGRGKSDQDKLLQGIKKAIKNFRQNSYLVDNKNPRGLKQNVLIFEQREIFLFTTWESSCCFYFCQASCSPFTESAQLVWSSKTPIFHRVIRVKVWGPGYHVHGHSVSSRFSAEAQCVPLGLPYSTKVEKQLCEDYQSSITANATASAPLNLIMSIGKHIGSVYWLQNQELKGCCCYCCRPWGKLTDNQKTLTLSGSSAVKLNIQGDHILCISSKQLQRQ